MQEGDPQAAQLLPLVYDELRKRAAGHMANEAPGHTLDAMALVHEAYLRLVGPLGERTFANRGHFFAAAAEAMRRSLVDSARHPRREMKTRQPMPSSFARRTRRAKRRPECRYHLGIYKALREA